MLMLVTVQIYKAIPFLFELRVLVDWICTDTVCHYTLKPGFIECSVTGSELW